MMIRHGVHASVILCFFLLSQAALGSDCAPEFASITRPLLSPEEESALDKKILNEISMSYMSLYREDASKVKYVNQKVIEALNRLPMEIRNPKRTIGLSGKDRQALYRKVANHPVASCRVLPKYDPSGKMGFCFGRAFTTHIEALRGGLDKNSIKKIWAVGALQDEQTNWGYHVSTIVRGDDGKWYAIDPIMGRPLSVEDWYKEMQRYDVEGKMLILASDPKRFNPHPVYYGKGIHDKVTNAYRGYSNPQILSNPNYNGYFQDLLEESRREVDEMMSRTKKKKTNY